jgi:hypothetical protein
VLQAASEAITAWLSELSQTIEGGNVPFTMPPQMDQVAALRHTDSAEYAMPKSLQDRGSEGVGLADVVRQNGTIRRHAVHMWFAKGNQMLTPEVTSDSLDGSTADQQQPSPDQDPEDQDAASCASRRASTPVFVDEVQQLYDEAVHKWLSTAATALALPAAKWGTAGTLDAYSCAEDFGAAEASADDPAVVAPPAVTAQSVNDTVMPALADITNGAAQQPAIMPVPRQLMRDAVCLSLGSHSTQVCTRRLCCLLPYTRVHAHMCTCTARRMRSLLPSACVSSRRSPAVCSVCVRTGQRAVVNGLHQWHDTARGLQLQPGLAPMWGTSATTARKKRAGTARAAEQVCLNCPGPGTVAAVLAQQLCCMYPPQLHE